MYTVFNNARREILYIFCDFCFFFWDRVSLYRPGCPGTHSVDQAGLELRNLPASASQVPGLKACATTGLSGPSLCKQCNYRQAAKPCCDLISYYGSTRSSLAHSTVKPHNANLDSVHISLPTSCRSTRFWAELRMGFHGDLVIASLEGVQVSPVFSGPWHFQNLFCPGATVVGKLSCVIKL